MNPHPTAQMGRRIQARLLDIVLAVFCSLAFLAFWFFSVFARSATPGQLILGLHHVDAVTGRAAGGKTFLKYLIQGFTFGLAPLITLLTTRETDRSWFDRMAGVALVDPARTTQPTMQPSMQPTAPPALVASPPSGWHGEESHLTQLGQSAPQEQGVVGGMIQSVPFEGARSAVPANAPRVVERSAPVVVEAPYAAPQPQVAPAGKVPVATLDTGEKLPVTGTMILGRAPRPSASLGEAGLFTVSDQSISANHLALGVGANGPWVMDLKSTNGSTVEQDGAEARRLEPLVRVPLSPGAIVKFGQRTFVVSAQ